MRWFLASSLCWDYGANDVLEIAEEKGFAGVEFWAEHLYCHMADPVDIRMRAESMGLALTLHASSWDLNMASINKGIRRESLKELKKSVNLAKVLGAEHITFHPGRMSVNGYMAEKHHALLVRSMLELMDYAETAGVTLSMELMEQIPKEMIICPESLKTLLEDVGEEMQVTLDIAHTPLTESNLDYLDRLERVNSIHLSDSSREKYHLPLGAGEIALDPILRHLSGIDLPVVLEGMDTGRELSFLQQHLDFLKKAGWMERTATT